MINPQQIKKALVKLAEFKKRPHYNPVTVRYIVDNFDKHPLREAILYFCDVEPREYVARLTELSSVCRGQQVIDLATRMTGIDVRALLSGKTNITNGAWIKLQDCFDAIDDAKTGLLKLKQDFEYECSFDILFQDALRHAEFNWVTKKYNDNDLNEAWLSFQDFKKND